MTAAAPHLAAARRAYEEGRGPEAQAACARALEADPTSAPAHLLMGKIAAAFAAHAKAADLFARAAALAPADAEPEIERAKALLTLNRLEAARAAAFAALARSPSDPTLLDTLGVVLNRCGAHEEAAQLFRRASGQAPQEARFAVNLGWAEQYLGDLAAAEAAFLRAIAADPAHADAYAALVELRKQTPDDNWVPHLEQLFALVGEDADKRLHIGHALAKSYEDLGDDGAAFDWLLKAKAAKRAAAGYDFRHDAALIEALLGAEPAGGAPGFPSEAPIFVIGLPRSGTTLVDRILSAHPMVASIGEPMTFPLLLRQAAGGAASPLTLLDPATIARATRLDFAALGRDYEAQSRPANGPPRFLDKTPLNFLVAAFIHRALPNARIVRLARNPMDSCLSLFRQSFAADTRLYRFAYDLEDTARYVAGFERLTASFRARLPADRYCEVRYEDLVEDHAREARRLVAFCGLPWDDACTDFTANKSAVATASAAQVRRPIYKSSVGRWRRYEQRLNPAADIFRAAGVAFEAKDS